MEGESTNVQLYERHKNELSLRFGCLLWGGRVIIPLQLHNNCVVDELHEAHPGIVKMKILACQYIVVARNRYRVGKESKKLSKLSVCSKSSSCAASSVGVATTTMVKSAHWSSPGENVSCPS